MYVLRWVLFFYFTNNSPCTYTYTNMFYVTLSMITLKIRNSFTREILYATCFDKKYLVDTKRPARRRVEILANWSKQIHWQHFSLCSSRCLFIPEKIPDANATTIVVADLFVTISIQPPSSMSLVLPGASGSRIKTNHHKQKVSQIDSPALKKKEVRGPRRQYSGMFFNI